MVSMQVDSGSPANDPNKDLETGGFLSDSEDEREKKEIEDDKMENCVEFNEAGKAAMAANKPATLVVAGCDHS